MLKETKLENGVEVPKAAKKSRARKKPEISNAAASLIAGLKFISVVQKKAGTINQQFCAISGNWIAAFNGVTMAATKIEDDLNACPHTFQLLDALSKCGQELTITQLSASELLVKSGDFKASIPCVAFAELELPAPDPQLALIDARIAAAFDAVACLATEGAPNATHAAVLLQAGTCVATNGHGLLEYWHGLDLPPGLLVPKASAVAVAKAGKVLSGFGYSGTSATFYFEDESFIKSQLYGEKYVNYQSIFNVELAFKPLPQKFFEAVNAVESFSKNGIVYFDKGVLSSREIESEAATFKIEGLPENLAFQSKYLLMLKHAIKEVAFDLTKGTMFFFNENIRGALMGIDLKRNLAVSKSSYVEMPAVISTQLNDDEIPF